LANIPLLTPLPAEADIGPSEKELDPLLWLLPGSRGKEIDPCLAGMGSGRVRRVGLEILSDKRRVGLVPV